MFDAKINHRDIALFAEDKVNLPTNAVQDCRDQINSLRQKLEKHIP